MSLNVCFLYLREQKNLELFKIVNIAKFNLYFIDKFQNFTTTFADNFCELESLDVILGKTLINKGFILPPTLKHLKMDMRGQLDNSNLFSN